jgi:glycosyltransferase involved in cell wall biosynthesis
VLRFGVLTYGLDRPLSGIGRSVAELGRALADRPDCEPVFLTSYRSGPFTEGRYASARVPGARLLPGLMTLGALALPGVARRHRLPLIYDPTGVAPFVVSRSMGPYKRVVTLHDAIPFMYPKGYTWLNTFLYRSYIPCALAQTDAVVTVSQASRHDLASFLHVPSAKLHVVPNAADTAFRPLPRPKVLEVAAQYGLAPPFVLFVGALQARKNLPTLFAAMARVRRRLPGVSLALVGRSVWGYSAVSRLAQEAGLDGAVRLVGHVPDRDLPALYNAASLLCLPSLYEGFGLPVLEAMRCGTPVVCSDVPALAEVSGGAALLVHPRDAGELARAIERVLDDPAFADGLRARGQERARHFSWARAADGLVRVFQQLLED